MRYYMLVVGLGLLGMAVHLAWQTIRFLGRTRKTYGVLAGWNEVPKLGRPDVIYYYAVVAYEAADGSKHCVTSGIGSSPKPKVELGRKYAVRYNLRDPKDARLDTLANLWAPAAGFLVLGSAALFAFFHPQHH